MHRRDSRSLLSLASLLAPCLAAWVAAAGPVFAADLAGRYQVATTGITIGQADLGVASRSESQAVHFRFENGSLLGLVEASTTRMDSELAARGKDWMPRRYHGLFRKEDREREVELGYGEGGAVDRFALIKRGQVRVSSVPEGLPAEAIDPLAALVRLRGWLGRAMAGDTNALTVFDGRKVYETSLRYQGPVQITQYGDTLAAHHLAVRYRQVAQLDEDEGRLERESDRERNVDVLLSADGRYLPLRVSGSFDGLPLTAELDPECLTASGCKLGE